VRVTVWGCRGSVPTPGRDTVAYGGNTSCVEVSLDDGTPLVLDAGTGIRNLGLELLDRDTHQIHLCLTHLHLDHLEGLRFFAPLWEEGVSLDIWGPPSHLLSLRSRIARAFSPPLFPVDLRDVPATVTFHDVPRTPWTIDGASLQADFVVHPGPTVGYRIESNGASFAYLPDHEPALGGPIAGKPMDWISGASLASGVDALIHDAQYFEDEYEERIGWGHSSVADAVAFTRAVDARRLLLFHHEPRHTDRSLERLEERARELAKRSESLPPELAKRSESQPPALAHEGMVVELS
jgi:phosphoribosyl 1,2-cyclic phosphodiesterase